MKFDFFSPKYKVRRDHFSGWEGLVKYWWWPFWLNFDTNTCRSRSDAWLRCYEHSCGTEVKTKEEVNAMHLL